MSADSQQTQGPLQIDLPAVLRAKLGARARFVPRWLVHRLERYICVDELNRLLRDHYPARGAEFCGRVLDDLGVTVKVEGLDNLPPATDRRVLFACNHPLGGADGLALIKFMHDYYGAPVYVVVNDILMAVEPLRDVFLPVNKHGQQAAGDVRRFDAVLDSDNPVLFFPAGLVSRLHDDGGIYDLPWKTTFVNKAIATGRSIVPLYFSGHNSRAFYKLARRRQRMGLKFNIEMLRLPRELVRLRDTGLTIRCGRPVPVTDLRGGAQARQTVQHVRDLCYSMQNS